MATLFYGSDTAPISLPDRLMGYIKVIASTKLRRGESFTLTWTGTEDAEGRSTIWLQPAIPLRFVFESVEPEQLVGDYLRALADQANAASGLVVDVRTWDRFVSRTRPAPTHASVGTHDIHVHGSGRAVPLRPLLNKDLLEDWLTQFRELGYLTGSEIRLLEQEDESDPDAGLIVVDLSGAKTVTYLQPIAGGDGAWKATMEARDATIELS